VIAGTSTLPKLFACSLLVTLVVTPAVTAYLNSKGHAHGRQVTQAECCQQTQHRYSLFEAVAGNNIVNLGIHLLQQCWKLHYWHRRKRISVNEQQCQQHDGCVLIQQAVDTIHHTRFALAPESH